MSEAERRFLRDLRDAAATGIAASRIGHRCKATVQALETCGAARWLAAGRGSRFVISDADAFDRFIVRRYPLGLDYDLEGITDRASAVAVVGDAKAVRTGRCEGLFVRSMKPGTAVVSRDERVTIPVYDLTTTAGGAAVLLDDEHGWIVSGRVAVIENSEAFWRHDRVMPDVDLAVYSVGTMSSRRLLAWLASMENCQIVHWGDYDPAGVTEYLRLVDACPGRVRYFMPPIVGELLPQHGKAALITEQVHLLDRLRQVRCDETVARLLDLFDQHRRGLEQEVLLCEPFAQRCRTTPNDLVSSCKRTEPANCETLRP